MFGILVITAVSGYILYNTMTFTLRKQGFQNKRRSKKSSRISQGIMYKRLFLIGLFITSISKSIKRTLFTLIITFIARTFTLIFDVVFSFKLGDNYD